MRKTVFAALAAALLTACGGGSSEELHFESAKVDRRVSLTNEENSPACNIHLDVAFLADSHGDVARAVNEAVVNRLFQMEAMPVQEAADSFANSYASSYVRYFAPLYREDRGDEQKRAWYEYHYNIDTETLQKRENTVTYLVTLDYYEGGAHGINQLLAMNFDTRTGLLITLADLFVPGYQQQLKDLLLTELLNATDSKDVDELHEKGYLYSMDMFAPENFILSDDAITFVYNPYEIAPYSMGKIELTLQEEKIEKLKR